MRQFLLTCHTVLYAYYCATREYLHYTFRNTLAANEGDEVKCVIVWASGHAAYGAYVHKPRCRANGVHSVREERSASAAARHLLGVARPIHHREKHHYSSPLAIPHHHSFAPCLSLSHSFRAFALGPTLPWIPHLVPRLKSIIKTWNANERF